MLHFSALSIIARCCLSKNVPHTSARTCILFRVRVHILFCSKQYINLIKFIISSMLRLIGYPRSYRAAIFSTSLRSESASVQKRTLFELSGGFISKYADKLPPFGYNGLGELVYRRTYSRPMENGQSEQWFQTCQRVMLQQLPYTRRLQVYLCCIIHSGRQRNVHYAARVV